MNGFEHWTNLFVYSRAALAIFHGRLSYGTADAKGYVMKHPRERGIYLTPNGESLVASRERNTTSDGKRIRSQLGSRLTCFLFGRYEWAFHGTPDYEVATTGKLLSLKKRSAFRPDELIDTGTTAGAH